MILQKKGSVVIIFWKIYYIFALLIFRHTKIQHKINLHEPTATSRLSHPSRRCHYMPPIMAKNPEYQGESSYFGNKPPLSLAVGYIVVLGFGVLFSLLTTL